MKKLFFIIAVLGFISACGNKSSLKPYYYPYTDFFSPKVYKYVNVKDSTQYQYWRFQTGALKGDTVMTTAMYNNNLQLLTAYHNRITDEGSRLKLMFVNVGDSTSMFQCDIKQDESFNWIVKPQVPLYLSYGIKSKDGSESREIVSERNIEPKKEMLTINGKNYECVVIKESTMINLVSSNRTRSEEQQRTSYFAKGVGLVQFETFHANGKSEKFQLQEIITDGADQMLMLGTENTDTAQ